MLKICSASGKKFQISPEDIEFYRKVAFPPPQLCPDERLRRRLAHRNEQALHPRTCRHCKKRIISMYHENTPFPVYCSECWWSDNWDPREFSAEFDFKRPFFEQFYEFQSRAPRLYMFAHNNDNCDYTNGTQQNKDCYLIFASDHNQDCLYSHSIFHCVSCLDLMSCRYSECCYECIGCDHCNELYYSQNCINCYSSYFLHNCKGCSNCLFCSNLRNKQFHIANQPVSKEDYYAALRNLALDTHSGMQLARLFQEGLLAGSFEPHIYGERNQDVSGDYVFHSKKSYSCFDSHELEDCKYIIHGNRSKNCYDGYAVVDDSELCHENISAIGLFNCSFTTSVWRSQDVHYSDLCVNPITCLLA